MGIEVTWAIAGAIVCGMLGLGLVRVGGQPKKGGSGRDVLVLAKRKSPSCTHTQRSVAVEGKGTVLVPLGPMLDRGRRNLEFGVSSELKLPTWFSTRA